MERMIDRVNADINNSRMNPRQKLRPVQQTTAVHGTAMNKANQRGTGTAPGFIKTLAYGLTHCGLY